MSEAENRVGDAPEGAEEEVAEGGNGSGGSLFHRIRSRGVNPELTPAERKRRLVYAGGGALVALVTAGLGVRWWRNRR